MSRETAAKIREELLSVIDATKLLGIGRTTFFKLIKEGYIFPVKILGKTFIPVKEIEKILTEGTKK
jgi:predicted DNA-binding transcriptional regulator AlpA